MEDDLSYPWCDEFRPNTIEELIGDESLIKKLNEYITTKSIPNLLLVGNAGTGKTSIAKILAKLICGEDQYLFINASENNNIDTIRNDVIAYCNMASFNDAIKIIVLDEFDGMTAAAQKSLKGVMEEYSKNTRFILSTNSLNKIIVAIRSRCQKFEFNGTNKQQIAKRCLEILIKKKIKPSNSKEEMVEGIKSIVNACYPDIRSTIQNLQKYSVNGQFYYDESIKNEDLKEQLIACVKTGNIKKLREEIITTTIDYKLLYDIMFDNVKDITSNQEKMCGVVLLISEYMYRHSTHINSEINFLACVIEIVNLLKDL